MNSIRSALLGALRTVLGAVRSRPSGSRDIHAVILPKGSPNLLGGPRSTLDAWARSGMRCEVLTGRGGQTETYARERGLPVRHVWAPPDPNKNHVLSVRLLKSVWWLVVGPIIFARYRSVEVESNHLLEIGPAARIAGKALMASCRGFPTREPRGLRVFLYRLPTAIFAIDPELRDWLRDCAGRTDARWIPIPALREPPQFDLIDHQSERRILIVGDISHKKGQLDFLRRVFPKLSTDWHLDVVGGEGGDRAYVDACHAAAKPFGNRVRFLGHVERWWDKDTRPVLVINSISEGGPRVAVEALQLGIPIVLRPFRGHMFLRGCPMAIVVDKTDNWGPALEAAVSLAPSSSDRDTLKELLDQFRADRVSEELERLRSEMLA